MPEAFLSYLSEYFPVAVFVGGIMSAYSKSITNRIEKESTHAKEYADLKVDNLSSQIADIKLSLSYINSSIDKISEKLDAKYFT